LLRPNVMTITGGKAQFSNWEHHKYTVRRWTMHLLHTQPVSLQFPGAGNGQYIHSVPDHVTVMP
jgi:hypothetical protein